jgi:hypothetical protein
MPGIRKNLGHFCVRDCHLFPRLLPLTNLSNPFKTSTHYKMPIRLLEFLETILVLDSLFDHGSVDRCRFALSEWLAT